MPNSRLPLWLRNVPAEWDLAPLGSLFRERNEATTSLKDKPLSVTKSGIVDQLDQVAISVDGAPKRQVRQGDIVINSRSDRKGSAGEAPRGGSVSVINTVLIPERINTRFSHHLIRSTGFQEEFYRFGSGIVADLWSTRWSAMKNILLPLPPISVQRRIANYLDHETTEIDAFISDQKLFLKLFLERERSEAFATLSNNASPGADSNTCALKRKFRSLDYRRIPLSASERGEVQGTIPYYGASGVIDHVSNYIFDEDLIAVAEDGANLVTRHKPICFAIQGKSWVNNHAHVLKPPSAHLRLWVNLIEIQDIAPYVTGAAQPKLTIEALMNLQLNVPDPQLWGILDSKLVACENEAAAVKTDIVRSIALARERRAALITAAVTGQIDVTARNKPAAEQLEDDIAQGLHREN